MLVRDSWTLGGEIGNCRISIRRLPMPWISASLPRPHLCCCRH